MTSSRSWEDWCDAQSALHVEGAVMDSVAVGSIAERQSSAYLAGPVADSQLSPGSHREWRLPSLPSSVTLLRWGLRAFLDDAGRSHEEREDLVLATCEATTNAVEHARHPTEPYVDVATRIVDDMVTIVVTDHGQWRPPTSSLYRGRGLAMMRLLADTSVEHGPHGTTVTLRSLRSVPDALAQDDGQAS
jgi:anti-sigma regulatory factor (Ser/Thr protein kinase)